MKTFYSLNNTYTIHPPSILISGITNLLWYIKRTLLVFPSQAKPVPFPWPGSSFLLFLRNCYPSFKIEFIINLICEPSLPLLFYIINPFYGFPNSVITFISYFNFEDDAKLKLLVRFIEHVPYAKKSSRS